MEKIRLAFNNLSRSIYSSNIDFSLFIQLQRQVEGLKVSTQYFEDYIQCLILIHQLSSASLLHKISATSITLNQMSLKLKLLTNEMIIQVILWIQNAQKEKSFNINQYYNVLCSIMQIAVVSTRILLNQSKQYINQIKGNYRHLNNVFDYVQARLQKSTQFQHHLNILQLHRYRVENQSFHLLDFQAKVKVLFVFEEINTPDYLNFIQTIILEVLIKTLKYGKVDTSLIKNFYAFISQDHQIQLELLIGNSDISFRSIEGTSPFFQIYNQIKTQGISSINIEYLEDFISNQQNFNDIRIFDIAALTEEPVILQIWYRILNSRQQKSPNLERSFYCFRHIVDNLINSLSASLSSASSSYLTVNNIVSLLKLSNCLILTLLTQKKQNKLKSSESIMNIIKSLIKVFTWLCLNSNHQKAIQLKDFAEKLVLVCSRYAYLELSKSIYSLLLYYILLNVKDQIDLCEQIFKKFVSYHLSDNSSELYKILQLAYKCQNKSKVRQQEIKNSLLRYPFIAILFAQNDQQLMILQQSSQKQFQTIKNKFSIYGTLLRKNLKNQTNLQLILSHLQSFLIRPKFDDFFKHYNLEEIQHIKHTKTLIYEILQIRKNRTFKGITQLKTQQLNYKVQSQDYKAQVADCKPQCTVDNSVFSLVQKTQVSFILINLIILESNKLVEHFSQFNFGIALNKYSKQVKMIMNLIECHQKNQFKFSQQFYSTCCCYLMQIGQKFKTQYLKKQRIGQPGQIAFVHSIMQVVNIYQKSNSFQLKCDSKANYLRFRIFQLDLLTSNHQKYIAMLPSMSLQLLKIFNSSLFLTRQLKQKLLRQIIKQSLFNNNNVGGISLKQLKEIIEITQDEQEIKLYIQCLSTGYGQEGKTLLMLMANSNPSVRKVLLNQEQDNYQNYQIDI